VHNSHEMSTQGAHLVAVAHVGGTGRQRRGCAGRQQRGCAGSVSAHGCDKTSTQGAHFVAVVHLRGPKEVVKESTQDWSEQAAGAALECTVTALAGMITMK
jgi:hypothetical protein